MLLDRPLGDTYRLRKLSATTCPPAADSLSLIAAVTIKIIEHERDRRNLPYLLTVTKALGGSLAMISGAADVINTPPATSALARFADRWIYVFTAALFIITALAGFIPDSIAIVTEVRERARPPLPPVMHVHALLMGSWLLLLFTQALLMAMGRRSLHRKIGAAAVLLVPLILVTMVSLVRIGFVDVETASAAHTVDPAEISNMQLIVSSLLPEQARAALFFSLFTIWGLWVRNRDPQAHKRLMVLATLMPLPAGIDRIEWLPSTLPGSSDSSSLYMLLWLSPVLLYDLLRCGRLHRVYVIGLLLNLPLAIASHFIAGSAWWIATAPRLVGIRW
jgi:hypothetical protein